MDVQSAVASTQIWPVAPPAATTAPAPAAPAAAAAPAVASTPTVAPAPKSDSQSNNGGVGVAIGPTPGLATLPASGGPKHGSDPSLAKGVALLFNSQEQNVSVSFQVESDPNEIVTVFTDKSTGKVIVQFPSETMIALAKFFDNLDGSVVNKKV
jgi:hypothetical protein